MTGGPSGGVRRERWLVGATEYAGLTTYTGGIGRHYAALLPALARRDIDVDLAVFANEPAPGVAEVGGVRVVAWRDTSTSSRTGALVSSARSMRRLYRAGAYDRVFLPEWGALGAMLPAGAPLLTNLATSARLAYDVAGLRLHDLPIGRRLPVALQMSLETRQIRRSAGVIAISTSMLERTEAMLGRIPAAVIVRNCIDVEHVRVAARTARLPQGWPTGGGPVVLFLGRAERRKGVGDAFAAFAEVQAHIPAARLVVAGASGDSRFEPTRPALLGMLPPSARERVTWLGHVPGDELYRAIHDADVVMTPSRWEGFGNVALEVKAVGTPIVVTTGSGFDDFCTDGVDCLMVPPADPSALARAVQRVIESPALGRGLSVRAGSDIGRFAPDPVAADLQAAADTLLGPVPTSGRRDR